MTISTMTTLKYLTGLDILARVKHCNLFRRIGKCGPWVNVTYYPHSLAGENPNLYKEKQPIRFTIKRR
jgi:hypothetical protein